MKPMELVLPKALEDAPHEEVPYFFITKEGWYKNLPTLFGIAQVEAEAPPPGLEEWKPTFLLNDIKLPAWVLRQAHDFFRHIWNKFHAESSVYILYNRREKEFKLFAPEQYVSMTSVNHKLDRDKLPAGFTPVGTIHSHCNFSAFHSGTDTADMAKMPGLHITIGHVDRDDPEMVFALSIGEQAFNVERASIVDEVITVNKYGYDTMPPFWENFVHTGSAPWGNTGTTSSHTSFGVTKKYNPPQSSAPTRYKSPLEHRWDQQAWGMDDDDWLQLSLLPEPKSSDDRDYERPEFTSALDNPQSDDPFERYKTIVETSTYELDDLVYWLNQWGFHVQYTIIHDSNRAHAQKLAFEAREMMDDSTTP